jgi:hypothetical protein
MLSVTINISGRAVAGAALIGIAVALSSLGIVRAEREGVGPDTKAFNCTSGKACVEGNATGKNVFGVWGKSASGTGVQGNSTATNSNSGVAGVNTTTSGTGYGVYGRSSNGPGVYGTSILSNAIEGHNQCCTRSSIAWLAQGKPGAAAPKFYDTVARLLVSKRIVHHNVGDMTATSTAKGNINARGTGEGVPIPGIFRYKLLQWHGKENAKIEALQNNDFTETLRRL